MFPWSLAQISQIDLYVHLKIIQYLKNGIKKSFLFTLKEIMMLLNERIIYGNVLLIKHAK